MDEKLYELTLHIPGRKLSHEQAENMQKNIRRVFGIYGEISFPDLTVYTGPKHNVTITNLTHRDAMGAAAEVVRFIETYKFTRLDFTVATIENTMFTDYLYGETEDMPESTDEDETDFKELMDRLAVTSPKEREPILKNYARDKYHTPEPGDPLIGSLMDM